MAFPSNDNILLDSESLLVYPLSENSILLSLKSLASLYFQGVLDVKVLFGSIEVLGYRIKPNMPKARIYSLLGSSSLGISSCSDLCIEDYSVPYFMNLGFTLMEATRMKHFARDGGSIIILESSFLTKKSYFHLLDTSGVKVIPEIQVVPDDPFNKSELILRCLLDFEHGIKVKNKFKVTEKWKSYVNDIVEESNAKNRLRITLCGGKGVGKSTMARYIINQLLNVRGKCLFIDLDIGQTEFTLPGSISVTLVDQPLLGPNYSHLRKPLRCHFLGEVDPLKCLHKYFEAARSILDYCRTNPDLQTIPWCLNTMGFPSGMGLVLTASVIQIYQPTILIQIQSRLASQNYPLLTSDYVNEFTTLCSETEPCSYNLWQCHSPVEEAGILRSSSELFKPVTSRNAVILSYFDREWNNSLHQIPPIIMKRKNHALSETEDSQLNVGSIVGLMKRIHGKSYPDCLGFGVIRSIDMKNDAYVLATPLNISRLSEVDCLIGGNIEVPHDVLFQFNNAVFGKHPFLSLSNSNHTSFRPAKRRIKSNKN